MDEEKRATCHDPFVIDAVFRSMYTTQSHYRHRPIIVALIAAFFFFALPQAYATPSVQLWVEDSRSPASIPPSAINVKFSRRSAASTAAHDKFFVPAIAAMGVVLLIALLCCFRLLRDSPRPIMPPVTGVGQPQPDRPPLPFLSSQAGSIDGSESVSTRSRRQTKVQRKPAPAFQPSPARTPPGTASRPNFNPNPLYPTPGVPQHPSLATYNPEPLPFTPSAPMSVTRTAPAPGPSSKGYWTQEGPRMSALSAGSAGQSSTQIGSGASENALSYVSYVSRNGNHNQAQNQGPGEASGFAVPSQNPPSPPVPLPPVQRHQNRYSRRQEKTGLSYESTHMGAESKSSVAGSEWESRQPADTVASGLPSSSQPPQYYETKGFSGPSPSSSYPEKAPLKGG